MTLELHAFTTYDEAIVACASGAAAEILAGGAMVVVGEQVLFFLRLEPGVATLDTPSRLDWTPPPTDAVRAVNRRLAAMVLVDGAPPYRFPVFVRTAADARLLYAGPAAIGFAETGLGFFLDARLSRDAWRHLGGRDWLLEVGHEQHWLSAGDHEAFDALVAASKALHFSLRGYDEELSLRVNERRALPTLLRGGLPEDIEEAVSVDTGEEGGELESFATPCCVCAGVNVDRRHTVSRELGLAAFRDYFITGAQPSTLPWGPPY